jgi:hypothetical protein
MGSLYGWLFDHLGLKLVALLLAVLVYLNVYLEREATLVVAFPVQAIGLPDSLAVAGGLPDTVRVELRGRGKALLRLKLLGPPVKLDLGEARVGRVAGQLTREDLPIRAGDEVRLERFVAGDEFDLRVEPRLGRRLPVQVGVVGQPASGSMWTGAVRIEPESVEVSGPRSEVLGMRSVAFGAVRVDGRRDTVVAEQAVLPLGPGYRVVPDRVLARAAIEPAQTRQLRAAVHLPGATGWRAEPDSVNVVVTAARGAWTRAEAVVPTAEASLADTAPGGRAPVRAAVPGLGLSRVRAQPESVTVRHVLPSRQARKARGPVR